MAAIVSAKERPRGISSERKRPITSPWPAVLTSSPGTTTRSRPRASSRASSAPPRALWSVTAIAPSPSSSACSRSSPTSTRQSCDQLVCVWRSQRIHSRSASGSASRRGRLRPEQDQLPVGNLAQGADHGAGERPLRGPPFEHGEAPLLAGAEQVEVDPRRDDRVLAGKARRGGLGGLLARRHEGVDAPEQALALAAAWRVAEPCR